MPADDISHAAEPVEYVLDSQYFGIPLKAGQKTCPRLLQSAERHARNIATTCLFAAPEPIFPYEKALAKDVRA